MRLAQFIEQQAHFSTVLSDSFLTNDKNVGILNLTNGLPNDFNLFETRVTGINIAE
jgi:hypothetical protein